MKKFVFLVFFIFVFLDNFSQKNKIKEIDYLYEKYNGNTPGCAIGVIKNGKLIYTKGYGSACLDYKNPITADTKFLIGSITKQFTGACIAMLITENKIKINDDIRKYISEFPFYGDTIRISHLLYHTSGIKDYGITMQMAGINLDDHYQDYNDLLSLILNQSNTVFKPGEKYLYSNSNYTLLGEIVHRVSGQRIEKYAKDKIFKPLGMSNTHYWVNAKEIISNRAYGYQSLGNNNYEMYQPFWIPYSSGNICSTVNDLGKWSNFIISQYQKQTDFIKIFTQIGSTNNGNSTEYAFGINISYYRGLKTFEHGGALMGYKSEIVIYPDQDFSIIVLGNLADSKTYSPGIAEYYLKNFFTSGESYKKPVPKEIHAGVNDIIRLDTSILKIYDNYYELGDGYVFEVKSEKTGLNVWQSWDNETFKLYPINDSSFIDSTCVVRFDFYKISKGLANRLNVTFDGRTSTSVIMYYNQVNDSVIQDMCGFYFNSDIKTIYHFEKKLGDLYVKIGDNVPVKVIVVNENLLSFYGFEAILKRDNKRTIIGMEVTNQQFSRNNVFKKLTTKL